MDIRLFLVSFRREFLPDMPLHRVTAHGALDVGPDLRNGMAHIVGKKIVGKKVIVHDRLAIPVNWIALVTLGRAFAGMAAGTVLGEDNSSPRNCIGILGKVRRSAV